MNKEAENLLGLMQSEMEILNLEKKRAFVDMVDENEKICYNYLLS